MTRSSERIVLPGVSQDAQAALDRTLAQLNAKAERNILRAGFYDGRRVAKMVGTVIPPIYQKLALVLGWSAKGVDLLARRCNLDGFTWPDGDLDSLGLRAVWDGNMLGSETNQGITEALIHATTFIVTTKGVEGEPPALIHFRDAMSATGEWNPRTRHLDNLLSVTGRDVKGKVTSLALYLPNLTISAERDGTTRGGWNIDQQDHPWGVPAEVMAYKPRLRRPFGSSRISRPVMSLQDQATREVLRLEGHMDVFSFPEMWMLGADESIFKDSSGAVRPTWQVMLGRIKGLPDDEDAAQPRADVKQFPASDPTPHLAALNAFAKMMSRELSLPDTALAITDVANPTSAESYDSSQYELIHEAEGATDDWSPALRRSLMRALAMANGLDAVPAEWATIDSKWRNPRYLTRSAQADAGQKQLASVPWLADTKVGLELLGLTSQQIDSALSEHRRATSSSVLDRLLAKP